MSTAVWIIVAVVVVVLIVAVALIVARKGKERKRLSLIHIYAADELHIV